MSKRIVKETLGDGRLRYRVETNRLFGFIPIKWTTCIDTYYVSEINQDCSFLAVYDNLSDAQRFCGIVLENDKVIKREVI
jgi:hypothetical protein